jgi:hypothetical protein
VRKQRKKKVETKKQDGAKAKKKHAKAEPDAKPKAKRKRKSDDEPEVYYYTLHARAAGLLYIAWLLKGAGRFFVACTGQHTLWADNHGRHSVPATIAASTIAKIALQGLGSTGALAGFLPLRWLFLNGNA